ncbi:hypothetical protein P879_08018 [Paragonimus westermani]|uniref:Uncharacterized protein n=1 Tax=Paragonimus westermani TaxID=34504 RepID=A0A8T0DD16_9TREM|nr:hypothetical protein P879_08018 [Paragonimus westermani]
MRRRTRSDSVMPTEEEEEEEEEGKLKRASTTESGEQLVEIQNVQEFSESKANGSTKSTGPIANSITTDPTMAGNDSRGCSWNSKTEPTVIRETNAITSLSETNTKLTSSRNHLSMGHANEENRSGLNVSSAHSGQKTNTNELFGSSVTKTTEEKPSPVSTEIQLDSVNSTQTKPEKTDPITPTDKKVQMVIVLTDDEEMEEVQEVTDYIKRSSILKEYVLTFKKEMSANWASPGLNEDLLQTVEGKQSEELTPAECELFTTPTQFRPSDYAQSEQV